LVQTKLGPRAAAKVARTLQAGIRACSRIQLSQAKRTDLPEGYFRVVAKTHLIVFQIEADTARVVRILHGARDIAITLDQEND
jgi:plasmid stabilization system protein ParE